MSDLGLHIIYSVAVTVGGLLLFYTIFLIIKKIFRNRAHYIAELINKYLHLPGILLFIIISFNINIAHFEDYLPVRLFENLKQLLHILLIVSIGFLLFNVVNFITNFIIAYYKQLNKKDYTLRSVKTKYQLIQRVINFIVIAICVVLVLMTFDEVKKFGGALLASASVAGLVIGFAAQKSLGTLFSGIQIAITQPVKLDDTVMVEKTYGTIGEITLTYVVIHTWDEKRLILPINYFLEKPFENWTRDSPEVIAKVNVMAKINVDISEMRKEFNKWLEESTYWDKRSSSLYITDADTDNVKLRATMSAKDAKDSFVLEYEIREHIVNYLKNNSEKKTS